MREPRDGGIEREAIGLDEAVAALNKMGVSRKVLIIVGDGKFSDEVGDYKKKLQSDEIAPNGQASMQ